MVVVAVYARASGPTAAMLSPAIATALDRCTMNCGSIVRTVALVRRRSQMAGMTADYHL